MVFAVMMLSGCERSTLASPCAQNHTVTHDCAESLFPEGALRLPAAEDYKQPSFVIDATDPPRIEAQYSPLDTDMKPNLLLSASATKTRANRPR